MFEMESCTKTEAGRKKSCLILSTMMNPLVNKYMIYPHLVYWPTMVSRIFMSLDLYLSAVFQASNNMAVIGKAINVSPKVAAFQRCDSMNVGKWEFQAMI